MRYIIRGINPTPWTAPEVSVVRGRGGKWVPKVYKKNELRVFQDAIKEALEAIAVMELATRLELKFHFYRNAGTKHDHIADATNLQKATEDAIQGVLIANDRDVVHVNTWVVAQGPEVKPLIVIEVNEAPPAPQVTVRGDDHIIDYDIPLDVAAVDSDFDTEDYF